MEIDYTKESNGDVTVTPKINKGKLITAIIMIALLTTEIVWLSSNNNKKKIKEIKAKITAIQAEKEAAIADSLRSRNIFLTDIELNRAWNADYDIENHIVQCSSIWNCPLGKLYSKEEIERMNADLQARRVKRAKEMHPVPGFAMGVLWYPYISEETTIKELVKALKHIDPMRGEMYIGCDGNWYELSYPIRFPDKDPNIIVDKEGNWCLTDPNLVLKFLDKDQKANLMNSALTLYTANEEMEVVKDIRDYFDRQTDPQIKELLKELGKRDYMAALNMQRKIFEQRR